jgi:hypothetical protein
MSDHARDERDAEPYRAPALRNLVREENKHRALFRRFLAEFDESFGVECGFIGPAPVIVGGFLAHGAMAVTIAVLALEWMSQDHYIESVKDDRTLDPHFKSLLKHHWEEELQHARIDELLLRSMAAGSAPAEIDHALDEFFAIGAFLDGGLRQQAELDLEALQRAVGRELTAAEQEEFRRQQHQALRWTFLGTTMRNANFLDVIEAVAGTARGRLEAAGSAFSIN